MSGLYTERLENHRRIFEERFPAFLPKAEGMRGTAARAMAYACEAGGQTAASGAGDGILPLMLRRRRTGAAFCRGGGNDPLLFAGA